MIIYTVRTTCLHVQLLISHVVWIPCSHRGRGEGPPSAETSSLCEKEEPGVQPSC